MFNLTGGVSGQGYDTFTINDPGAVNGNESFTVNGNLGGGQGNNTFLVTSGLNYFDGSDTYLQNGNLIGGAGFNTFSLTDSNHAGNRFTLNGSLIGGTNDTNDSFDLAGTYGALHLVSGTGTGADTYQFTGGLQANLRITAPDQTSRVDLLDFSSLNSRGCRGFEPDRGSDGGSWFGLATFRCQRDHQRRGDRVRRHDSWQRPQRRVDGGPVARLQL